MKIAAVTYYRKYGKIYGISYKYEFGEWKGYGMEFDNFEEARKWLHTEEGDFRIRELVSKKEALKWGLRNRREEWA